MPYIYHYHAMIQQDLGEIMHIDGMLTCADKIDTMERYSAVKNVIANNNNYDEQKLIITSLSFLHKVDNA